jgi:2-polyprenyl-3-methyl-5-hydroxy-6-metoxy-1,4-benzoquinol methylase
MQRTEDVRTYFTDRARLFDALYDEDASVSRGFNRVFRRPMFTRYIYTLGALGDLEGRRILDVGCGSGRYSVELARQGAQVVGVDFSEEMLTMARERAEGAEVTDRTTFISGDFTTWAPETDERFDAAFAMGVLDYVDDATRFLEMMADISDEVIASFPTPTPVRMPLRKLRYSLRKCPVYFYWRKEIERIYRDAGMADIEVRRLGFSGYWARGRR